MNNTKVNYTRKMNVGSVTTPVYKLDGHTQNHRPPLEIYVLLEYHLPSLKVCTVKPLIPDQCGAGRYGKRKTCI